MIQLSDSLKDALRYLQNGDTTNCSRVLSGEVGDVQWARLCDIISSEGSPPCSSEYQVALEKYLDTVGRGHWHELFAKQLLVLLSITHEDRRATVKGLRNVLYSLFLLDIESEEGCDLCLARALLELFDAEDSEYWCVCIGAARCLLARGDGNSACVWLERLKHTNLSPQFAKLHAGLVEQCTRPE